MGIIGNHVEESTPFLKEYLENPDAPIEAFYRVSRFIATENGILITIEDDQFVVFVFKNSKLFKALMTEFKNRMKPAHGQDFKFILTVDESRNGSFLIEEDEKNLCSLIMRYSSSGNKIYEPTHYNTLKEALDEGVKINPQALKIMEKAK